MKPARKFYPPQKEEKRLTIDGLKAVLESWDSGLEECDEMNLIACGNTALALMGHKSISKDIELLVPEKKEYGLLILYLKAENYRKVSSTGWQQPDKPFIFHLYSGRRIYSVELLNSPLEMSGHKKIQQWEKIYLGILNPLDLIISKLFRGTESDIEDCRVLLKREPINLLQLRKRCRETAAYDLREAQVTKSLERLLA